MWTSRTDGASDPTASPTRMIPFQQQRRIGLRWDGGTWTSSTTSPPLVDTAFLAPAMVLSIITMIWRLRPLAGYCVVGNLHEDFTLYGYPYVTVDYLDDAISLKLKTLLLPKTNAEELIHAVAARGQTLEELGVRVIGCSTMMEVVCWAFFDEDAAVVMGGEGEMEEEEEDAQGWGPFPELVTSGPSHRRQQVKPPTKTWGVVVLGNQSRLIILLTSLSLAPVCPIFVHVGRNQ